MVADFSLNVYNGYTIQVLRSWGASRVTISHELTFAQVGEVRSFGPSECIIHGRLPVISPTIVY